MPRPIPIITDAIFFSSGHHVCPPVSVSARPLSSLSLRTRGRISICTADDTLYSGVDSLTYIPKGCAYVTEIFEEDSMEVLHFYSDGDEDAFSDRPLVASLPDPGVFRSLFRSAIKRFDSEGCDLMCMKAAYEMLHEAEKVFFDPPPLPHTRMIKCKEYIDSHICDTALRINELAKMCGVSEVYFRREFKKFYGASPLSYIKQKRIDLACRLLSTGLYSVTDAAMNSGFDNVSYFSAEFGRMMGCSPREYGNK